MVSHQLVYVTGMLEVILAPSAPSGRLKTGGGSFPRPRKASGTSAKLVGYQAKFPAPEGAVRDVGQVCRVPGKLRRRPQPPRGLGNRQNRWRKSASTSGQPHQIKTTRLRDLCTPTEISRTGGFDLRTPTEISRTSVFDLRTPTEIYRTGGFDLMRLPWHRPVPRCRR